MELIIRPLGGLTLILVIADKIAQLVGAIWGAGRYMWCPSGKPYWATPFPDLYQ